MKKMFFTLLLAASFSNSFAMFTVVLSAVSSGANEFKAEAVVEEAITHVATGEIIDPSDSMKLFLKKAKPLAKEKSDLQILEQLVEETEEQQNTKK